MRSFSPRICETSTRKDTSERFSVSRVERALRELDEAALDELIAHLGIGHARSAGNELHEPIPIPIDRGRRTLLDEQAREELVDIGLHETKRRGCGR